MKLTIVTIGLILVAGALAQPQGRIAGGEDAVNGQLPYQAALSVGGSFNCGAVIIGQRYALTALTCVCSEGKDTPWPAVLFAVTVGSVDLYSGGKQIRVEDITLNPNYSSLKTGIALLRLQEDIPFGENVAAIPLSAVVPPLGAQLEVSGWGRTTATEVNMHRTLQIGEAQVEAPRECILAMASQGEELAAAEEQDDQVLCLGHGRRQGICSGDIGGPAVYQGQLVGLGAQILGECGGMLPERFVSIAANYDWIQQQLQ
ncbi:serine protease SP24D [Drosophila takahashii]|uniref:serine protease SP24D n=1 Tax=Drosophila takahashii TaxID=29030 RepID=UPI001CF82A78|nr:serine protease SP24D [Drosophila takahashii]